MAVKLDAPAGEPGKIISDPRRELADVRAERDQFRSERDEALAQQTAMAEVLGVINASPGDLAPVFEAMLDRALRLCDAALGTMQTWDGGQLHRVALRGASAELAEALREPIRPTPGSVAERVVRGERTIRVRIPLMSPGHSGIMSLAVPT